MTSQKILKCAGKGIWQGRQWSSMTGVSHDLFLLSLLWHCVIGLQRPGLNLLNKSTLSGVKVKTLSRIDGVTSLDFNFYPGKEKTKFESFYAFSATYFNWQSCNSLERHNYRLAQTQLDFLKKELLCNFLLQTSLQSVQLR